MNEPVSQNYQQVMIRDENQELDLESAVSKSLGLNHQKASHPHHTNQEIWYHSEFIADITDHPELLEDEEREDRNNISNVIKSKKFDDRLFPDHLLYCEGMQKPAFRGILHLICSVMLPFVAWQLIVYEANGLFIGQIAASVYISGQFFCCFVSALYHIGKHSPSIEIVLQKLDHCGIAVCTTAVNYPVSLLLLPSPYGGWFLTLSTVFCLWTCWNIFHRRPGVWRLVITASVILFFLPLLAFYMTWYEFSCVIGNIVFMVIGVYIFANRRPDPIPDVFGYHEVFHVFTVLGFICIYLCNWSVIRRTCNPYHMDRDIFEDVLMRYIWG